MMVGMRLLLLPILLLGIVTPAAAERLSQDVCDKLSKGITAMAGVFADTSRLARSLDKPEVRAYVGPKTREAVQRLAASREQLDAAIRDYSAAAAEAAARLRQCSD